MGRLQDHSQNILSPSVILIITKKVRKCNKRMLNFYFLVYHNKYLLKIDSNTILIQKLEFTAM